MAPFRLFDLPRELRNLIYEHAIKPKLLLPGAYDVYESQLYVQHAPNINILLASRQLNLEYHQQIAGRTKLLAVGPRCTYWMGFHRPDDSLVRSTRHCTAYVHLGCRCDLMDPDERDEFEGPCDAADTLEIYVEDLQSSLLNQIPHLETVQFKIGLWCAKDANYEVAGADWRDPPQLSHTREFQECLVGLTSLPHMRSIDIHRCANDTEYDLFCEGCALPLVATWTRVDGWHSNWK